MPQESVITNPLLQQQLPIDFGAFRADQVEPAIAELIPQMQARIDALGSEATKRTYRDILLALDTATDPLDFAMGLVRHLESVMTTPELRAAYNAVQEPVSAFYTAIRLNPALWSAVKAVAESEEAKSLDPVHQRYLEKTVKGFVRSGADLPPEKKRRLEEINIELTRVTTRFSENVLDATNAYEKLITDERELAGLPESALMGARESAKSKGKEGWRLTLQAPSYVPALTYLDKRELRQELWEASNRRATSENLDNRPLVRNILRLRREKAQLLGFKDFADYVLEERMAKNGGAAQAFLSRLQAETQPHFERENNELAEWGKKLGYDRLEPWDVGYVAEKQRRALYDFDEEELRPYFPLDKVESGMFDIFSRVLGIQVIADPDVPGWDPAVRYYRVEDAGNNQLLGGFYTDWFPRENKRGGAWMDSLVTGSPDEQLPHVGLICGNLTPPAEGRPSLLTHREVETIFHEFGHLLHHVLSRVPIRSLAGTNVPWDFVELPSQIMENWCMNREALNTFARHYQTGEPIPQELFEKMHRARTFRSANGQMRQLGFGTVDLALHRDYDPESDMDVMQFALAIQRQFTPAPLPDDYAMIASFTHLFSSPVAYGSGYYSYKWAEVLDADAFTRFQKEGVFNKETGLAYRRSILERGNSEEPELLYREFMGRDPDPKALLERLGLLAA